MARADTFEDLTVSLERHLLVALQNVRRHLPSPLADELAPYTSLSLPSEPTYSRSEIPTIPYQLLLSLSKWARSPAGLSSLRNPTSPDIPALDPADYSMVALLAGTTTSPNRRFPAQSPPQNGPKDLKRELNDRKAIVAVINGMLSVGGTGVAVWWAAGNIGWRHEWRVLLSFLAAAVVAFSEVVLYIIWESRRNASSHKDRHRQQGLSDKKHDGPAEQSPSIGGGPSAGDGTLRHRTEPGAKDTEDGDE